MNRADAIKLAIATFGSVSLAVAAVAGVAWLVKDAPATAAQKCVAELQGPTIRLGNSLWAAHSSLRQLEAAQQRIEKRQRQILQHAELDRLSWAASVMKAEAKP